jgi:hypothetical protein
MEFMVSDATECWLWWFRLVSRSAAVQAKAGPDPEVMAAGSGLGRGESAVLLAAVLAAEGLRFVLVGSTALWMQGETISVADVDAVPCSDPGNIRRLHDVLGALAVRPALVPPLRLMFVLDVVSVQTSYGKLDCLLERGRRDWGWLRRGARVIRFCDVDVLTASAGDAKALRLAFKPGVKGDGYE